MRGLTLFLIELVGIAIGLAGYLLLPRDAWAWRRGFLFFAFMNMAAIPTHNILGTLSPTMLVFWSLDVGSTGSSCLCLILASFIQPFPTAASRTPTTYKWLTLVGPALLYAYSYVGIALPGFRIPFTSELVYITMMVIAAVVVVANILAGALRMPKMPFTSVAGSASVVLAISSIIVMLAGFLLDYPICKAVVEAGSTTEIGLVAFVFVGSDIAFLSLFLYVAAGVRSIASKSKKTQ
ncbi:hypothetical protein DFJ73DRAFT_830446 [Zopfochytrium polystomum]|nr:hypothetical protein DFJ73DRAFT_830446 [Zopfochytrium polystomum]